MAAADPDPAGADQGGGTDPSLGAPQPLSQEALYDIGNQYLYRAVPQQLNGGAPRVRPGGAGAGAKSQQLGGLDGSLRLLEEAQGPGSMLL